MLCDYNHKATIRSSFNSLQINNARNHQILVISICIYLKASLMRILLKEIELITFDICVFLSRQFELICCLLCLFFRQLEYDKSTNGEDNGTTDEEEEGKDKHKNDETNTAVLVIVRNVTKIIKKIYL
ncbi:hypothetical protein RFI_24586 [Reticulomyxa filosa]|uniref:Uncharacterized protein n=1 Tax=Reticulomyxa filosa TaxID=46433 RepID=X6MFW2_RETFI|nr:hypothetical protein RFI_24586 [Reticulomyxa filosa]|eukprot:ETO12789.1 hypothetical protein RFI_24586 [Reticulomyxa filosa]